MSQLQQSDSPHFLQVAECHLEGPLFIIGCLCTYIVQDKHKVFFLQCRIAQDSCGHIPARTSQKEAI